MSETTTTNESTSSRLETEYKNAKTIKESEFYDMRTKLPVWSIVCIEEWMNKPYILLGKEGDPESNIWVEFNGEDKPTLEKYYDCISKGKQLFKDKAPDQATLDHLRRIIVAIGTIVNFLDDLPADISNYLLTQSLTKFAVQMFLKDHPNHAPDIESVVNDEESAPYLEMVVQYAKSITSIITSINANTAK